jgi:hypothetical protein
MSRCSRISCGRYRRGDRSFVSARPATARLTLQTDPRSSAFTRVATTASSHVARSPQPAIASESSSGDRCAREQMASSIGRRNTGSRYEQSAELPTGHKTTTGQRADQEAKREGVTSEMDVEEVAALRLRTELLPEHLYASAFIRWCHESEVVERCGRILVSIRLCDPRPDEADQSGLLCQGSQTLQECALLVCQGLEVDEQGSG